MNNIFLGRWKQNLTVFLLFIPMMTACGSNDIPVSIHAINYSDQEFIYQLEDVANPFNKGGGESIGRYGAGGTMCCFSLPKKWRPGIKIKIDYIYYLRLKPDGTLPEFSNSTIVEMPQYEKPEELWVMRSDKGTMSIVNSNYQPDHPKWPGKIKGWPAPSLEYQRQRSDIYIKTAKRHVRTYEESVNGMKKMPNETAKESWDFSKIHEPEKLIGYTGYMDKKYQQDITIEYNKFLLESRRELNELEKERP